MSTETVSGGTGSGGTGSASRVIRRGARTAQLSQEYRDKVDAEYRGKVFDIVREVHLDEGQVFVTKLGNKCRHGYVIRDRATGEEQVVGVTMLKVIHDRYIGVSLPRRTRKKPPT